MLPKISITLDQGALGLTNQTKDGVAALILGGVAVSPTLAINTTYAIYSLDEAIAKGITSGGTNDYAYQQIKGFYDEAGNGAELFIMITDQTLPAALDKANAYAKKLLQDAKGSVRLLAAGVLSSGTETIVTGLDENAHLAVPKAQALAVEFTEKYRPLRVIVGGNAFTGTPANLFDYKTASYNRVAMFIGAEDDSKTACIGKLLGRLSASPVQRKPSRVLDGAIQELTEAYLTDGDLVEDSESKWDAIHDKGYIFLRNHVGRVGYYFTSDPTLTTNADDYNSLARGRVIDKAYLITYDTLLNNISDEIEIAENGTINPAIIKAWEGQVESAINTQMKDTGTRPEISNVAVTIDPKQKVLQNNRLDVEVRIQPVGYADFINVTLGYALTVNN